jgi:thioredoxin reductase (NADPH)
MLANTMKQQAKSFGCKIKSNIKIARYQFEGDIKIVALEDGRSFQARSIILTPGGRPRSLNIAGEEQFKGKGISYCATCDGDFFTGKEVVVVGGGNSALEEAVALTQYATKVTIVHQFDHFQAFKHAVEEAQKNPKIEFVMESELRGFYGNGVLQKVEMEHLPTGKRSELKTDGTFIFVGYQPNTESLEGLVHLNERKEIAVDTDMRTNVDGVFAAGDCINKKYRQVTTAVAEGTIAALSAAKYLSEIKVEQEEVLNEQV